MYVPHNAGRYGLRRPNTVRFNTKSIPEAVTPEQVYRAVKKELDSVATVKCIAELDNKWYNITFDNERHSEFVASHGLILHQVLVQCERASDRRSVVCYVKVPYEISDETVATVLSRYGTVANVRRQYHNFDKNIETGVRSCLIKNLQRPIPSYIKLGTFTLPVRYRGQQKTCKICESVNHIARDCPTRGRCFVCGSYDHQAAWHDNKMDEESVSDSGSEADGSDIVGETPTIKIPNSEEELYSTECTDEEDGGEFVTAEPQLSQPKEQNQETPTGEEMDRALEWTVHWKGRPMTIRGSAQGHKAFSGI